MHTPGAEESYLLQHKTLSMIVITKVLDELLWRGMLAPRLAPNSRRSAWTSLDMWEQERSSSRGSMHTREKSASASTSMSARTVWHAAARPSAEGQAAVGTRRVERHRRGTLVCAAQLVQQLPVHAHRLACA